MRPGRSSRFPPPRRRLPWRVVLAAARAPRVADVRPDAAARRAAEEVLGERVQYVYAVDAVAHGPDDARKRDEKSAFSPLRSTTAFKPRFSV